MTDQAAALRPPSRRRSMPPRQSRPAPGSDKEAGSGTFVGGVFTPSRNTVGGRLVVLPLSPQARNVNTAFPLVRSAAVGVKVSWTLFQSVLCPDAFSINGESISILLAVPVMVQGFVLQLTPMPPTPRNTFHCSVVSPVKPTC